MLWHRDVVVITTAQLNSTNPEVRFCADSNRASGVTEIRDAEGLWQWSRLKLKLSVFRRSTIPQKQFITTSIWLEKLFFGCLGLSKIIRTLFECGLVFLYLGIGQMGTATVTQNSKFSKVNDLYIIWCRVKCWLTFI